jgi:glutathione reductase (NADPH)
MEKRYDLVVIGTGVASKAASRCRAAGWSVAIVDSRPFGGTCALRGCVPKKVLVAAAEAVHAAGALGDKGVKAGGISIDWPARMRVKRGVTDPIPGGTEQGYAKAGIEAFRGRARFTGPTTIAVGDDRLTGNRVLIAAGAMPQPLGVPGAEHVITSEQFMELDALPPRIVFIGGGFVSFEFAHLAARAGVRATIVHRGAHPLEAFDPGLVDLLVARTRELAIGVELGASVRAVERAAGGFAVRAEDGRRFEADLVVHGAGRIPEIADLDLETASVRTERRGVSVNEYLQSVSNSAVYAAGDAAASGPPLTPVADHQSDVVATNLLEGNRRTVDYTGLASAVFTVPPLASAGLTEHAARAQGLKFTVHREDTSAWLSSQRVGETASGSSVLIEDGTDRILGAHLFGPRADEVINVFALAIRLGARAGDLKHVLYAYPTVASDIPFMV